MCRVPMHVYWCERGFLCQWQALIAHCVTLVLELGHRLNSLFLAHFIISLSQAKFEGIVTG